MLCWVCILLENWKVFDDFCFEFVVFSECFGVVFFLFFMFGVWFIVLVVVGVFISGRL